MPSANMLHDLDKTKTLETSLQTLAYASFGRRLAAFLVDKVILVLFFFLYFDIVIANRGPYAAEGAIFLIDNVLPLIFVWLYYTLFECTVFQATPGKLIMGIYVTNLAGQPISFWRATVRHLTKALSGFFFGLGYLQVITHGRRQGLHDEIARCLVLHTVSNNADSVNDSFTDGAKDIAHSKIQGGQIPTVPKLDDTQFSTQLSCKENVILNPPVKIEESVNINIAQAGQWREYVRRVLAFLIDYIIFMLLWSIFRHVLFLPVIFLPDEIEIIVQLLFYVIYNARWESSVSLATPGKTLMGLYVTNTAQRPLDFNQAFIRNSLKIFSGLCLGIGFIQILFDPNNQGFHDRRSNSIVLGRPSKPFSR